MPAKKIPTLSLFSGAGGLDLGFRQAGFDIVGSVEIDPGYCATLSANADAHTTVHCQDIRQFDTAPYRKQQIRCVIGGPPCQTFSAAGRRSGGVIGIEDARGQLFKTYCRILRELKPEVFVFENVYGLPGANGGGPWRAIVKDFSKLGYRLSAEVVDAADYGVPQHRERLILVGYRTGQFTFPMPTHGPDSADGPNLVPVEDAIRDLQDPNEPFHNDLGGLYGHLLTLVPEGLNYSYFTAEMGHPEPVFAWRSKFHDLLYKVARNEPCRTLKAQPGKFTGPFHWKNRHFTTAELKRLQTFPDSYNLLGGPGKVLEQIGNSVPPRLAFVLAQSVRQQLLERSSKLEFRVRPPGFTSTFRQRQRQRNATFKEVANAAIAAQFAAPSVFKNGNGKNEKLEYYLNPHSIFDRKQISSKTKLKAQYPRFAVAISEKNGHVDIDFERIGCGRVGQSIVEISGLRKYLPHYDSLTLSGRVSDVTDIFHAWGAIEDALTHRSRFFSLIDIYGHYANRGDTVKMKAKWRLPKSSSLLNAINRFSDSMHCGEFIGRAELLKELKIFDATLNKVIASMREIRFDIRTDRTHPIISADRVLCTYPFPLLSRRALVESKVQLLPLRSPQGRQIFMDTGS